MMMQSAAGSLACFLGGFITSLNYLQIFVWSGTLQMHGGVPIPRVLLVSILGTAVESLPIKDWDNLTVTVAVAFASQALLA